MERGSGLIEAGLKQQRLDWGQSADGSNAKEGIPGADPGG